MVDNGEGEGGAPHGSHAKEKNKEKTATNIVVTTIHNPQQTNPDSLNSLLDRLLLLLHATD